MTHDTRTELVNLTEKIKESAFQRVDLMSKNDLKEANNHLVMAYNLIERRKGARRR